MSYKIVMDSCGELPESYKKDGHFERVPLTLDIDGHLVVDDETFDQGVFAGRYPQNAKLWPLSPEPISASIREDGPTSGTTCIP